MEEGGEPAMGGEPEMEDGGEPAAMAEGGVESVDSGRVDPSEIGRVGDLVEEANALLAIDCLK